MIKLQTIEISGFKAIDKFVMTLGERMTLLVGLNGSGKSSVLQALGFARSLIDGTAQTFFDERGWNRDDLKFKSVPRGRSTIMSFKFQFASGTHGHIEWEILWGLNGNRLFSERVSKITASGVEQIVEYTAKAGAKIERFDIPSIQFPGSVLPAFEGLSLSEDVKSLVSELVEWASGIRSLELLSPVAMKKITRLSPSDIGIKGDKLAGFIAALSPEQKSRVVKRASLFYPLAKIDTVKKRAGWIDLKIAETYTNLGDFQAVHMSDGFMRLLALCALPELGSSVSLILLDEVEDGIEPHILSSVIGMLRDESSAQIIATSHSPVLANLLDLDCIRVISRTPEGRSTATNASAMPSFLRGSEYMGPGEIWANTAIETLQQEAREHSQDKANTGQDVGK